MWLLRWSRLGKISMPLKSFRVSNLPALRLRRIPARWAWLRSPGRENFYLLTESFPA